MNNNHLDTRQAPAAGAPRDVLVDPAIISWGAVFAGTVTVFSVSILLGLLGASLGFGSLDPLSDAPAEGLGLGFAIWTAATLLISLAAGGFVAGYLAGAGGWTHGFLSWSLALVAALVVSGMAVSGTLRMASSIVGSVASATGSATGGLVSSAADRIGDGVTAMVDRIEGEVELDALEDDVIDTLRATEIDALNPDPLQVELEATRDDVGDAISALQSRPDRFEEIVDDLLETLAARADNIVADIDRDEAVDALVANTDLTRPQAEAAIDDAIAAFEELSETAQAQVAAAQETVENARAELAELEAELRVAADEAATAASRGALWAFVTLLLGGAASVGAGIFGRRQRLPHGMGY